MYKLLIHYKCDDCCVIPQSITIIFRIIPQSVTFFIENNHQSVTFFNIFNPRINTQI
jgi:hypothetical protein